MRKQWIIAAALLLAAGTALYIFSEREPEHAGKPFSYWFREACLNDCEPRYAEVDEEETRLAMKAMGTNAAPYLVSIVRETRPDSKFSEALHQLLKEAHLSGPYISNRTREMVAWHLLTELKPPFEIIFPDLEADLKNPARQNYGLWLLGCVGEGGEKAVPVLVTALKSKDQWARQLAAQSLLYLGPKAKAATPALIEALDGKLINAAAALGKIGPEAKAALPKLESLLATTNHHQRLTVARAMCQIEGQQSMGWSILTNALASSGNEKLQKQAQHSLREMEDKARFAVPLLLQNVNSTNMDVWHDALWALQKIDPASLQFIIPILTNLLTNTLNCQDLNAAAWLVRIDPNQPQALDQLDQFIRAPNGIYSSSAVAYLEEAGCTSEKAIAAVKFALSDPRTDVREAAKRALRKLERKKAAKPVKRSSKANSASGHTGNPAIG